jgi:hypothetical protein
MMNSYKYILAAILVTCAVISCEKWPDRQVFEGSGLGAVTKYYEIQEGQDDVHVDVIATMPYEIRNSADWISVPATSQARDGFTISCQPNTGLVRQATIILAIEKTSHYDTVVVRQNGTTAIKMLDAEADGVARIAMNSQVGEHELTVDYYGNQTEWISDLKVDGNDISFTYLRNELNIPRFASVIMTFKDAAGVSLSHRFDVLQRNVEGAEANVVDLTEGGKWANCYLLDEADATSYSFEPKHVSGEAISGQLRTAEVLWETAQNTVENLAYDHTANKIFFTKTAGAKGNAVIALKDYNGNLLWSCHLWATSQDVKEISLGGVTFLDRNIGAVANTAPVAAENDAVGMFYQWGRKDPFPAPSKMNEANGVLSAVYPANAITLQTKQSGVTLETAILNPTVYYWGNDNVGAEDWSSVQNDGYWNTASKTDYDPCPYGYVVPDKTQIDALIASRSGQTASYGNLLKCDDGTTNYLSSAGWFRRKLHATSQYAHVGQHPHYWSTTTVRVDDDCIGSYATDKITVVKEHPRRWGATIRCVKQTVQPVE